MSESDRNTIAKITTTTVDSSAPAAQAVARPGQVISITTHDSVKDAGRVHVGGGMMRF